MAKSARSTATQAGREKEVASSSTTDGYVNAYDAEDAWLGMFLSKEVAESWLSRAGLSEATIVPSRERRPGVVSKGDDDSRSAG